MRWLAAVMAAIVMTGCYRTVYVPTESEYASKERERVLSTVADTVIVAERCTVRIMPEGTSSVVQREVQRVRMMRDTVSVLRTDTVRVVQPQPYQSRGKTHEMIYGKIWWWMMAGAVLGLGAIALLRKIYRCRI